MGAVVVRRWRVAGAGLALALLCACSGDPDPEGSGAGREEQPPAVPLPDEPPPAAGKATGDPLSPVWLESSSGTAESITYGDPDARAGTIVVGDLVVAWNRDVVTGTRLADGEQLWQAGLDMEGGQTCLVTQPDGPLEVITVVYGDLGCAGVARISVADGEVLATYELEDDYGRAVVGLGTYGDTDVLVQEDGSVHTVTGDDRPVELVEPARGLGYFQASGAFTHDPDTVLVTLDASGNLGNGTRQVRSHALPDGEEQWRRPLGRLVPRGSELTASQFLAWDGRLLVGQAGGPGFFARTVDPATGEDLGTAVANDTAMGTPGPDGVDLFSGDLYLRPQDDSAFMPVGDADRIVQNTSRGVSRIGPDGELRWIFGGSELELRRGIDDAFVRPVAVTDDETLVLATASNGQSIDLLGIDAASGTLVARWAVPEEYSLGLATGPDVTLVPGKGVLLSRNLQQETYRQGEVPDLEGDPYDVGFFAFP